MRITVDGSIVDNKLKVITVYFCENQIKFSPSNSLKLIFLCTAVYIDFYAFAVLPSYLMRRFIGSRDFGMT